MMRMPSLAATPHAGRPKTPDPAPIVWEQAHFAPPVLGRQVCVHCGRRMGDTAGGFGSISGQPVCHPNSPDRPDCYHLATIYALTHPLRDCSRCAAPAHQAAFPPAISRALAEIAAVMNLTPANRALIAQIPDNAQTEQDLPAHLRFLLEVARDARK